MPSDEQKHIKYASYILTLTISRFFELISILLVALSFRRTLIPVTLYSFLVLFASLFNERLILLVVGSFRSKLNLMNFVIACNRFAMLAFGTFLLIKEYSGSFIYKCFIFLGLTSCTIVLKVSIALFLLTFRNDWLRVLSNSQQSVKVHFDRVMYAYSVIISLLLPVICGFLMTRITVYECAKLLIYASLCGVLIEMSLYLKLYNTCFALHLPRSQFTSELMDHSLLNEAQPMIGVLTTPTTYSSPMATFNYSLTSRPLTRILAYVKRKPVPVLVTFGVQLINVSLITIGPHMVWFLLRSDISPTLIGVAKMLQTLFTLHPTVSAPRSFTFTCLGSLAAITSLGLLKFDHVQSPWWIHIFVFSVVLARSGIPTINLVGEQFVEEYLADDEMYRLYRENAVWLGTQCEMGVHLLTIIWPHKNQFFWPMIVSAVLTITGMAVILRVIKMHLTTS